MKESKKITAGINVKLDRSATLYHTIRAFVNMKQGEAEPNYIFNIRFDNIYETMELSGGWNIL